MPRSGHMFVGTCFMKSAPSLGWGNMMVKRVQDVENQTNTLMISKDQKEQVAQVP